MRTLLALAMLPALCALPAAGQPAPTGAPFSTTHFTAEEYGAKSQNWGIAQDARGLMYVANNGGILQYDGARWRVIGTGTDTFVRSVAADSQGTVYAGAVGDFGVLRPDSTATLQYVSLSERLPQERKDFGDVWYTHAAGGNVYFQTRSRLFRWDGDTLRSWKSPGVFHTSFVVRGQLYVRESGRGLLRMEDDSLNVVPGGERFAHMTVYVMVPLGPDGILVGTSKEGFFRYDGKTFEPFSTGADTLLEDTQLYHGCQLPGGEVALATLGAGVFIIDRKGRLVQTIDQRTGLPDGTVTHVYSDGQGGLWMALHNGGVFRAEASSPLSRFGEGFGLDGIVYDLNRHAGTLYAATGAGVYRFTEKQTEDGRSRPHFEKTPGVPATWDLLSPGEALYAATRGGVYRMEDGRGALLEKQKAFSLADLGDGNTERLLVGTPKGLSVLRQQGGDWTLDRLARTDSEVRSIATAEKNGALWFSTLDGTAFRFSLDELRQRAKAGARARPQRFDTTDGLPSGRGNIASFRGAPMFMSKKGLYRAQTTRYDTTFYRDTTLTGASLQRGKGPLRAFYEADSSNAWLFYDDRVEVARRRANGTYARAAPPALQFSRSGSVRARIEPQEGAWISNGEELIRYDAARAERLRGATQAAPEAMIRQVRDASTDDIIYGGAARYSGATPPEQAIEVPYRQNSFRVAFALPRYGGDAPSLYQYRLKGKDEEWSEWGLDAATVLGRFREGAYTVQVRARNANAPRTEFSQASLTLEVLPPWYRTVWAYLAYLGLGVLAVLAARRYRRLQAERREAREAARHHRRETEREREAREQLEKAHERLEKANRLKENFLTNTSHELRTPLTSILGYAEVLQEDEPPPEDRREFLDIIQSSGQRLLNTVNMLLEISQLRAGTLRPDPHPVEVNEQVEEAAGAFRERAERKGLSFHVVPAPAPVQAALPAAHFRRILENLVDNAIKFTEKGVVRIVVHGVEGDEVRVDVSDTGIGMEHPRELFEDFKQGSEGVARSYEGNGLGLTIAGRLASLMGGAIEVESAKGDGSCFTLRLPRELEAHEDAPVPRLSASLAS